MTRVRASKRPPPSDPHASSAPRSFRLARSCAGSKRQPSGIGRENGWDAIREYTAPKTLVVRITDEPEDWFAGGKRHG